MYTIGELTKLTGLTRRSLRFYETRGLLVPEKRQDNKYRSYSEKNLDRVSRIQFFKKLGFSLDEIKKILNILDKEEMLPEVEDALKNRREKCLREIKELNNQEKTIGQFLEILKNYRIFSPGNLKKFNLLSKKERGNIMDTLSTITDNVTCFFNHGYFQETLEEEFRKARENSLPLSVLIMDLDFFKKINDELGHTQGDRILKQTGEIIRKVTGDKDILCRYGGDEFTVTCINTEKEAAKNLAEKIRKAVEEYDFITDTNPVKITTSIGVAGFPYDCDTKKDMIFIADKSLYEAKKGGRNRVCYKE